MSVRNAFSHLGRAAIFAGFIGMGACGSEPTAAPLEAFSELSIGVPTATIAAGNTMSVIANAIYSTGRSEALSAQWTTSDALCATVDATGLFRALHSGMITLTAQAAGRSAVAQVQITPWGRIIGPEGGSLESLDGIALLEVPVGTLATPTFVTSEWSFTSEYGNAERIVPGTAYSFGFNRAALDVPVQVRLRYDPAELAPDARPVFLRLHRWNGSAWEELPGGSVDVEAGWVEGFIDGEGVYGVAEITPPVDRIVVEVDPALLRVGETTQALATLYDLTGAELSRLVTFSTSDNAVLGVDTEGRIIARAPGTADVLAAAEGRTGGTSVEVVVAVRNVVLEPSALILDPGQMRQVAAKVWDGAGRLNAMSVTWFTMDAGVARVSESGMVTGLNPGDTRIGVMADGVSGWATVHVNAPSPGPVWSVDVAAARTTIQVGWEAGVVAIPRDELGTELHGKAVTWTSSDPAVGEVFSSLGYQAYFVGRNPGTFWAIATSDGVVGEIEITVTGVNPPAGNHIWLPTDVWFVHPGDRFSLGAVVMDGSKRPLPDWACIFETLNPDVVALDEHGAVRALARGHAVIRIHSRDLVATVHVTVGEGDFPR